MFRFFENLIDPYAHLPTVDAPPRRLWPFLWHYLHPFRRLFLIASVVAVVVALVEVGLISYMG
ncbi:MAG: multidrug ABC transporter ATP-binding protein, partial [Pseudomonadota bacterium]|nr:multidrug ABC transporter ATP-binding protein [Pseudomonadota bacterium]